MPYRIRVRKFLNRKGYHAGAYIIAEVEDSSRFKGDEAGWGYIHTDLTLADCGRSVSFEFPLSTAGHRRNSLRKLDIMIDTLSRFREALEAEADLAAEQESIESHLQWDSGFSKLTSVVHL